ncbi:Transmembrane protein 202 [Pteropus alecto]|uniref:Transmembrane protein 202 n=1 Tax=Pteropus alecto TaxID=9402 RepID=L5JW25_PTEAL|nr:Transmembrane protein 202 [Pteropus alecto]
MCEEVLRQIPWQLESELAAKMEREEQLVLTFHNPKVPKLKGNREYQRPTLPTNKDPSASMLPQRRQEQVDQTHIYIRMFCGSLCGFSLLLLICVSTLNWVQFLVIKNGLELYAGLWISCNHELCWSHTPKPPYYLQYSRAFFLVSVLTILIGLSLLFSFCLHRKGNMNTNLDLKVSMLSFISGIISFLNYLTFRAPSLDQNVTMSPVEKSRLGIGPVTTVPPTEDEGSRPEVTFLSDREEKLPNADLPNAEVPSVEVPIAELPNTEM